MNGLTQTEKERLERINLQLSKAQHELAPLLDGEEAPMMCDERFEKSASFDLHYYWHETAPQYRHEKSNVATVFEYSAIHPIPWGRVNWNDFSEASIKPGGQNHCYWFFKLYAQTCNAQHLTWTQIAHLGGAYCEARVSYIGDAIKFYANETRLAESQSLGECFLSAQLNTTLVNEERRLKQSLINLDQAWLEQAGNSKYKWRGYDLTLHFIVSVESLNSKERLDGGYFVLNATGISQGKAAEFDKFGANTNLSTTQFNQPCSFLYQLMQRKKLISMTDIHHNYRIKFFVKVRAKSAPVIEFD